MLEWISLPILKTFLSVEFSTWKSNTSKFCLSKNVFSQFFKMFYITFCYNIVLFNFLVFQITQNFFQRKNSPTKIFLTKTAEKNRKEHSLFFYILLHQSKLFSLWHKDSMARKRTIEKKKEENRNTREHSNFFFEFLHSHGRRKKKMRQRDVEQKRTKKNRKEFDEKKRRKKGRIHSFCFFLFLLFDVCWEWCWYDVWIWRMIVMIYMILIEWFLYQLNEKKLIDNSI